MAAQLTKHLRQKERKTRQNPPAVLTPTDLTVLSALGRFGYLTAAQVCRLFFSRGSLRYAQTKLKRLTERGGLCLRLYLPKPSPAGRAPSVYCLSRRGLNVLAAHRIDVWPRYRPSEQQLTYLQLRHSLALNDALIQLTLLARWWPALVVRRMLHERELRARPAYVVDGERRVAVIFDAWVDLHVGEDRMPVAIELDRATHRPSRWREAIRHRVLCARTSYAETFGAQSLTIAVITTGGDQRLHALLSWTEAELAELGEQDGVGQLFLFTAVPDPAAVEPAELFLAPRWYRPFDRQPVPLLEGMPEDGR